MDLSPILTLAIASVITILVDLRTSPTRKESSQPEALRHIIPSPRETLIPHLTPAQINALAYPPNFLPGARDVDTPYSTMRVYEWGPENGKKVVLIHGDTTPGPMLAPIAKALVSRGCRVMIYGTPPTLTFQKLRLYLIVKPSMLAKVISYRSLGKRLHRYPAGPSP